MSGPFPIVKLKHGARGLLRDRRGGTAIEYGLILALIVLAMIGSLQLVANQTVGTWGNINNKIAIATGN